MVVLARERDIENGQIEETVTLMANIDLFVASCRHRRRRCRRRHRSRCPCVRSSVRW